MLVEAPTRLQLEGNGHPPYNRSGRRGDRCDATAEVARGALEGRLADRGCAVSFHA
jgi:hypothetical protein